MSLSFFFDNSFVRTQLLDHKAERRQAAAVSNEKLAGSIDGVGQCFSEKKLRF